MTRLLSFFLPLSRSLFISARDSFVHTNVNIKRMDSNVRRHGTPVHLSLPDCLCCRYPSQVGAIFPRSTIIILFTSFTASSLVSSVMYSPRIGHSSLLKTKTRFILLPFYDYPLSTLLAHHFPVQSLCSRPSFCLWVSLRSLSGHCPMPPLGSECPASGSWCTFVFVI